jgi:5S rRNA maturation endonuclease (ribonuclease M5)
MAEKDKKILKENLLGWIEILKKSDSIIIVEGKKDLAALERLGIINAKELKGPIFEFCENISKDHKEAILLTDLDSEGKRLYSIIKENLERNKVKVDNSFRNFLFRETVLKHIEGLDSYIENLGSY